MRSGIRQTIKKAFRHSAEPWFPGLADRLTEIGWQRLAGREFFPANYGTHRWLRNDPSAERWAIAELAHGGRREYQVEVLPASSRGRYEQLGLVFGSFMSAGRDISAVDSALSFITLAPSLHVTVTAYLRILHILQAPSMDHDISHSDPEVPFSIFLSVPLPDKEGRVRLAESIVHECMHLQLTMIEAMEPLVSPRGRIRVLALAAKFAAYWRRVACPLCLYCNLRPLSGRQGNPFAHPVREGVRRQASTRDH